MALWQPFRTALFMPIPNGYDPINSAWRIGVTQWYRPIAAIKFGLQYSYMQTNYFQYTTNGTFAAPGSSFTSKGGNHNLFATGYYFF